MYEKQCIACGRPRGAEVVFKTTHFGELKTCNDCMALKIAAGRAGKKAERAIEAAEAKQVQVTEAKPAPCLHLKRLCGEATIRIDMPGFFDTHEPALPNEEWQACVFCGDAKKIVLHDPLPFLVPYKQSLTALTPTELKARREQRNGSAARTASAAVEAAAVGLVGAGALPTAEVAPQEPDQDIFTAELPKPEPGPYAHCVDCGKPLLVHQVRGWSESEGGKPRCWECHRVAMAARHEQELHGFAQAKSPLGFIDLPPLNPPLDLLIEPIPLVAAAAFELEMLKADLSAMREHQVDLLRDLDEVRPAIEVLELKVEVAELRILNDQLIDRLDRALRRREEAGVA